MGKTEERLSKSLSFFSVYAIGTGTMIGAGIFVLPGIAITTAGPAAMLSFIIGGLITLVTTLSIVELATGMPKAGGSYYFISRALGPLIGTVIGLGAWLALVFKGSFALIGLAEYLRVFFPLPLVTTAIVAGLLLVYLNFKGAKSSGQLQNIILVGLITILLVFIMVGAIMGNSESIKPFMPYGVSSVFRTTGIIFISYLGITQLAAISEEVKDPEKNIPRAFIGSVVTVILIYAGVILVVNALVPLEELLDSNTPLVTATRKIAGTPGAIAITIAGLFATVSTANAAIMSSSRFPFAMARDKMLPGNLIEIHDKYKTPYKAIILTGAIMIFLLLSFDVESLAKLGSTINVLIFVLINFAVIVFRRSKLGFYEPSFLDPFFPVTQIAGIIGSLALLPSLGWTSVVFAIIIAVSGIIWYLSIGRKNMSIDFGLKEVIKSGVEKEKYCQNEILVPISNPSHEKDLLYLASILGDMVIGLSVIEVPDQTDLESAQEDYHESKKRLHSEFRENSMEWIANYPGQKRHVVAFDRSIDNAIIDQGKSECVDLIVMGWGENRLIPGAIGSIASKVINKAENSVAILKGCFDTSVKDVLIAYNKNRNAEYGLSMGVQLAEKIDARVTLFHIINPESSEEEEMEIREHMEEIAERHKNISIKISKKFSLIDALIDESENYDLLIMGDKLKRRYRGILNNFSNKVMDHAKCSVLIVKKYETADRYLKYFE